MIIKETLKKYFILSILCTVLGIGMVQINSVAAEEKSEKSLEQLLVEWEEAGIDSNHTVTIENIRKYLDEKLEPGMFSSLHIDREERPLGIIVLSFTEEISPEMKEEIESLVEDHAEVSFRVVEYTEEQLMKKQDEINVAIFEQNVLEEEGITVFHTGTDIITNKVEIGISPYNENTINIVHEQFGDDMINVVQGQEAQLLNDGEATVSEEKKSLIEKIIELITGLFK